MYTSTNSKINAINKFILYDMEATQPWVMLYEEKRRKCGSDRKEFKKLNGKTKPSLDHLKENIARICPNNWVVN